MAGIGDAVQEIVRLAQSAQDVKIAKAEHEKDGSYYIHRPGHPSQLVVAAPDWHKEKLDTPAELYAFVLANRGVNSAVFYTDEGVSFVYGMEDRRDRAFCALVKGEVFKTLENIHTVSMSQADFVRLLRITLRGCIPQSGLLQLVRDLKWIGDSNTAANIQHGRESIGRALTAEVKGHDAIPDELVIDCQVYENFAQSVRIACAIEIYPHEQKFRLVPYPLELRKAKDTTLAAIDDLFTEEGLPPCYRGKA